jgi:hypothetical protein
LRRILRWLIGLPIFVVVIGFAIANRRFTQLSLDPFNQTSPAVSIDLPLWLLFFIGAFIGILVGWMGCWFAQGKHRKLARERAREIAKLQQEIILAKSGPEQVEMQMLAPLPGIMP